MPSRNLRISSEPVGHALPEALRRTLETLSGYDLGDVRVHADSVLPGQVGARAFAHGSDIYLEPGAEDALAHEVWHVVQQKQGRVSATGLCRFADERLGGVVLNDEASLELEAERMGHLARSLALRAERIPAPWVLRFAAIARPVVQLHTTVADVAYTKDDAKKFEDEVCKQLGAAVGKLKELNAIIPDLLDENLQFADWSALKREVHIRDVGYQVEASMRKQMEDNRDRYNVAKEDAQSRIKSAHQQYDTEAKTKNILERRFQRGSDFSDYCDRLNLKALEGITRWGAATFLSKYMYDCTTRPMFKWLMDKAPEPQSMNCWEAVLFALVKTRLVDKTYIGWSNSGGDRSKFPGMQDLPAFTLLHQQLIKNMDYFWGKAPDAFGDNVDAKVKQRKNQDRFKPTRLGPKFFVPTKVTIPRGRVLLFNLGEHVAISTGKIRDLPQGDVTMFRYFQGTTQGHGMIELDGKYSDDQVTYRESCIEELADAHMSYLESLVVAPFPICLDSGQIVLKGEPAEDVVRHPDVVQAVQKFLDAHADEIEAKKADIYKRRDEKLAATTYQLLDHNSVPSSKGPSNDQEAEYARLEKELIDTQVQTDREINECVSSWKEKAKASDEVAKAIASAKKDIESNGTIVFNYNKNDPYGGAIQF